MKSRSVLSGVVAGAFLLGMVGASYAEEAMKAKPDATLRLESKSVAAGVGFSWGDGTLHYKGHTYKLKVDGLTVGSVGAVKVEAKGDVYNLKKLSDFDGNYTAVTGEATVGLGAGGLIMKNQNGVEIRMTSTTQGANLTAGVSGVSLAVKK
jgi:hypothetical protein